MVDKYEPISLIGKGNFGSISKIRRKSDGKILVWKELNYGSMKEKYKHHISSEINILKELHHPSIVKYYDRIIDKENTKIYIVMEYCPGGDLNQLIKRCRKSKQYINEDTIWKIFAQVVSALYVCHTNKSGVILHRDIKPSNVFLDNENNVKLGDFGLSLQLNKELNFAYSNVGTPYYMSPEQVDENKYNEKSDIWSLGCFLYELTALHPPFEAHNHLSLALKIKSGKIEKLPEKYSQNLSKVIIWLMNVDPNKRPSIKDIILIPEVSFKIKEKKVKDFYQKLKKFENELKIKEAKLSETEQKLVLREKYLDEREKKLIKRENNLNLKEGDNKFNEEITDKKNDLFITSGGFDIKGLNDEDNDLNDKNYNDENYNNDILFDEELNSIKIIPISNDKNYQSKKNINSMNESIPKMADKKYMNTIRSSLINDKMKSDYENNKIQNSRDNSLFSKKIKANVDQNVNSNSYKNLLTNNFSNNKNNNINTINFNNSNNSLSKINSNKNILDHSKVISFNSEVNYSSNDEKVVKNNNINTSNINNLGYLSINSHENYNMNIKSNHNNRQSSSSQHYNEYNKNSYEDNNNMKSGSTNYFSSVPRTSGDSYNENNKNNMNEGINSENININYNTYNIKNSQTSEMKNNAIINQYRDNYRMLRNENAKNSKRRLNIEYNKKFDSEKNFDEYNSNEIRKSGKNYLNKYIPNNFRNNSFGKKNNEQGNGDSSLNNKYHNKQKKYINFNYDTNNISNKIDNLKLSPESSKF